MPQIFPIFTLTTLCILLTVNTLRVHTSTLPLSIKHLAAKPFEYLMSANAKSLPVSEFSLYMKDDYFGLKGCNVHTCRYALRDEKFSFQSMDCASTLMFCPNDRDNEILKMFEQSTYVETHEGYINFYDSKDKDVLNLSFIK
jgi:heat shock protein HslJ